ncbi:hypothetical protein [Klebsiella sp. PL-2018]|uniref:hypothetical protein n=1 Tax=Klebsiella sp. PL-2018 TaxID=2851540 RepID=UPI001C2330AA|nr:hypothetical protein [Klebsiella sp. PL-2018]QXC99345.1 hypothetical protein MKleb_3845 [Klebsiella sp. PL-2018]
MNVGQLVLQVVSKNPGVMVRDIRSALPEINPVTLRTAIRRLYCEGKLSSVAVPGGFAYFETGAAAAGDCIPGGVRREILALEAKAISLQEKRFYRRAAMVWQQLCDSNCAENERERYVNLKNASLRKASELTARRIKDDQ